MYNRVAAGQQEVALASRVFDPREPRGWPSRGGGRVQCPNCGTEGVRGSRCAVCGAPLPSPRKRTGKGGTTGAQQVPRPPRKPSGRRTLASFFNTPAAARGGTSKARV